MYLSDITPEYLRQNYLIGVDLTDESGNPFPDVKYQIEIEKAIAWLERQLHVKLAETVISQEKHDYFQQDWNNWGFLTTYWRPIIAVESVGMAFPSEETNILFDENWITNREMGIINLIPSIAGYQNMNITYGAQLWAMFRRIAAWIPSVVRVNYTAGFADDDIPADMHDLVCKKAILDILNAAGDLVGGGPGIANTSLSIDGASQSLGTTASPTNAGFGARIINLKREIDKDLKNLQDYWKGINMVVL